MIKTKTGQLNISFAWIFAIIIGAVILFFAIYISTKVIKTGDNAVSAKTGKEISVLLNPLETGFEEGVMVFLNMPVETRIYNQCSNSSNFGKQVIKISQKSFNKWTETDVESVFPNKYIFSSGFEEGKNFLIFAKPFEFPFKVSDLIYLTSRDKNYCFLENSLPDRVKEELSDLNQENIFVEEDDGCPQGSIKVCFGDSGCDINVNELRGSVKKGSQSVYYETDALMYAAIFSDKNIYECQVKRLMQRTEQLSILYDEKRVLLSQQGCSDVINLQFLENSADSLRSSSNLVSVASVANEVNAQNNVATCKLW